MSDSKESGVTYTDISSPFEELPDIASPRADDHEYLMMIEDPYVELFSIVDTNVCDDAYLGTPRISALAGCDILSLVDVYGTGKRGEKEGKCGLPCLLVKLLA
nr:hypothetical protein [Tanacetum cinerariifolium]